MKNQSFEVLYHKQIRNARSEAKRNLPWSIFYDSHFSHFWSTSRSPFSTFYIPFQSSGSRKSNASNGMQFGVEMKELQPLQADHSKLKEEFCTALRNHPFVAKWFRSLFVQCCGFPPEVARYMRQVGSWEPQDESQLLSPARSAFCCEVISQPFLCVYEISQTSFSPAKWSLVFPDICDRHFEIFFFRFLCLNFHFLLVFSHSCNSLARKYPRKGKLPSYINSLVNTKKEDSWGTLRGACSRRSIIYRIM